MFRRKTCISATRLAIVADKLIDDTSPVLSELERRVPCANGQRGL